MSHTVDHDAPAAVFEAAVRLLAFPDERLAAALAQLTPGGAAPPSLGALQEEHTRLFVTAWPTLPAPPYEACYVDADVPTLLGALDRDYEAHGFAPVAEAGERSDHLLAEVGFVAHLVSRGETPAARDFVRAHPGRWLAALRHRVDGAARLAYYPDVLGVLAHELEDLVHG